MINEEEAIEILDTLSAEYYPNALEKEALYMAIKALEQQPYEDCISREAVDTLVDELARAISDERCFMSRGRSTATIMQDMLDLPSVTPQQSIEDWLSTFNTESATECFTAVQQLKEKIYD